MAAEDVGITLPQTPIYEAFDRYRTARSLPSPAGNADAAVISPA